MKDKMTSEDKLGLVEQPKDTCSYIDLSIKKIISIDNDARRGIREYKNGEPTVDDLIDYLENIEYYSGDLESELEIIRDQCIAIRKWGQDWKDLAKELLEKEDGEK